ncbi:MAG: Holliday junction resolvase RuvX, partial [Bacillota bacterium]
MRIGGLDVGDKTIGVAVSDELGLTAQGLEVIRRRSLEEDLARLDEIARQYGIVRWVVGMP